MSISLPLFTDPHGGGLGLWQLADPAVWRSAHCGMQADISIQSPIVYPGWSMTLRFNRPEAGSPCWQYTSGTESGTGPYESTNGMLRYEAGRIFLQMYYVGGVLSEYLHSWSGCDYQIGGSWGEPLYEPSNPFGLSIDMVWSNPE